MARPAPPRRHAARADRRGRTRCMPASRSRSSRACWAPTASTTGSSRGRSRSTATTASIVRWFCSGTDITGRQRHEQELREARQRLAEAQAIAHIGSWEWDIAKDEVRWSDELHRLYGVPADARLGYESFLDLVHPDDRERVETVIGAAVSERRSYEFECPRDPARRRGARLLLPRPRADRRRRPSRRGSWAWRRTSPIASAPSGSATGSRRSCTRRSGWRASASSRAASPTTSTTCWR